MCSARAETEEESRAQDGDLACTYCVGVAFGAHATAQDTQGLM